MADPSEGQRRPSLFVTAALIVAMCAIGLNVAASTGADEPETWTTFASESIACAPSPSATGQVFLRANATDKEVIVARIAIASVPGVTIDRYLDRNDASRQLACLFRGMRDGVHDVRPVDASVSFAITADDGVSLARLRAIPNVLTVVTPTTWNAWVAKMDAQSSLHVAAAEPEAMATARERAVAAGRAVAER